MLQCPSCRHDLRLLEDRGVEIDICDSCDAIWLDPGELNQVVSPEQSEFGDPIFRRRKELDLQCPRCLDNDFCDLNFAGNVVSRCNDCGGVYVTIDTLDRLGEGWDASETKPTVASMTQPKQEDGPSTLAETAVKTGLEALLQILFSF